MLAWDATFNITNGQLTIGTPEVGDVGALRIDSVSQDILFDATGGGVFQPTGANVATLSLLSINAGAVSSTLFNVDLSSGFLANKQFSYNGGTGADNSIGILATATSDTFNFVAPGASSGTFTLSNSQGTLSGTYANLSGEMLLEGLGGNDSISVVGVATADFLTFLDDAFGGGVPNLHFTSIESISVSSGDGDDIISVSGITPSLSISSGAGADQISFSAPIVGDVNLNGGDGTDIVNVLGSSQDDDLFVDVDVISGLGGDIDYFSVETMNVRGRGGDDTLTVQLPVIPSIGGGIPLPASIVYTGDDGTFGNDLLRVLGTEIGPFSFGADIFAVGDFGAGDQFEVVFVEAVLLDGRSGDDEMTINSTLPFEQPSVILGGPGDDVLTGGSGPDIIFGGDGVDELNGEGGNDYLFTDHNELGFIFQNTAEDVDAGDGVDTGVFGMRPASQIGDVDDVDAQGGFDDFPGLERVAPTIDPQFPTLHLVQPTDAFLFLEEALNTPTAVRALGQPGNLRGAFASFDAFIARQYFEHLRRIVDLGGLIAWENSGLTVEEIHAQVLGSAEYRLTHRLDRSFIEGLFSEVLGRNPTSAENGSIATRLQAGVPRSQIALEVLRSPEGRRAQVSDMFEVLVGRTPFPRDFEAVLIDVDVGTSYPDIAAALVASDGDYLDFVQENRSTSVGYVASLYDDVLLRNGRYTSSELRGWATLLGFGQITREQLAFTFLSSAEYQVITVRDFYASFLGRSPDTAGLNGWTSALAAGTNSDVVASHILGSSEYFASHGGTSEGYVRGLYETLLGRVPSQGEIDVWINALASSNRGALQARADVAFSFLLSDEYRTILVDSWYQQFFSRNADANELFSALSQFDVGRTREQVLAGILGTA